jgi:hypothetical protein
MEREPAPALIRGLHLLRILADGPPAALEDLVRGTAIPRSSLARMLEAMARAGLIRRDEAKCWTALVRIAACEPQRWVEGWRPTMAGLVATTGLRAELWRFDAAGAELDDAAVPVGWTRSVFAYRGWRPDLHELVAPVQLWWGVVAGEPAPRAWYMDGNRRRWLPATRVRRLADAVRLTGRSACLAVNSNGLVRHAVALRNGHGQPVGALVLVSQGWPDAGSVAALPRLAAQASR